MVSSSMLPPSAKLKGFMMLTYEEKKKIASKYVDIENLAKETAEAVNGGSWDKHYTEFQKQGWRLMVVHVVSEVSDMFAM